MFFFGIIFAWSVLKEKIFSDWQVETDWSHFFHLRSVDVWLTSTLTAWLNISESSRFKMKYNGSGWWCTAPEMDEHVIRSCCGLTFAHIFDAALFSLVENCCNFFRRRNGTKSLRKCAVLYLMHRIDIFLYQLIHKLSPRPGVNKGHR